MGRFSFMLIKSSPSYNTLISSSYRSFPSSVRCEVWFCEARMLVWLYTHLICPTKNLLQSAQFAGRRPLCFFLSPSSTHLASGDLLSQPARVGLGLPVVRSRGPAPGPRRMGPLRGAREGPRSPRARGARRVRGGVRGLRVCWVVIVVVVVVVVVAVVVVVVVVVEGSLEV